jgi:hypothetical protein
LYSNIPKLDSDYTQIPNELYLITESTYEDCLLFHLIKLQRNNKSCYVSLKTLGIYLHTTHKKTIVNTIQSLKNKGYIDYIKGNAEKNLANEYSVHMNNILKAIKSKLSTKDLETKSAKEYTEYARDKMTLQRLGKNPDLLIKAASVNGKKLVDSITGEILN